MGNQAVGTKRWETNVITCYNGGSWPARIPAWQPCTSWFWPRAQRAQICEVDTEGWSPQVKTVKMQMLRWEFNGISMGFQWDFNGISMGFQWDFNGMLVELGMSWELNHGWQWMDGINATCWVTLKSSYVRVRLMDGWMERYHHHSSSTNYGSELECRNTHVVGTQLEFK